MEKVFLSHSSADKAYVEKIAKQLGKDRCVYDAMCFEVGMQTIDEIFRELNNTGIFVLFISDTSLNSDWVKRELARAEDALHHDQHKLSQIFPIIVDSKITYSDHRIPDFLKKGFGAYNLRYIPNPLIAYRKITTQLRKYLFEKNEELRNKYCIFYGRNAEVTKFMEQLDAGSGINCFVASGINGVGRTAYIQHCLRRAQVIPEFYEPAIISMKRFDGIEDMLIRLSEAGFGDITINDLYKYPTMETKISALGEILQTVQNFKEYVIVYDDGCLVNYSGELVYWFDKALRSLRKEVTVSIAAAYRMREIYLKQHSYIFAQDLSTLPYTEWMGLMRVYAQMKGVGLSKEDRDYFKDILTGYPPQVLYCVDVISEKSLEYVQRNPYELVQKFAPKATAVLRAAIPAEFAEAGYGFLSFLSSYGVVPTLLVMELVELNTLYRDLFSLFKSLTICRYLGAVGEYIEVNPLIADYVQRNKFPFPADIQELLARKLASFNSELNSGSAILDEDFESVRFYLKENLKNGDQIPERFMYSSLYLSAIHELYNRQQYSQVINIIRKLKEVGALALYDEPARDQLIDYFCRSLAREGNSDFYTEVEHFRTRKSYLYRFLRGFMYRHTGSYDKALQQYNDVLRERPNHKSAMREIVVVYRGLGDYSTSFDFARANYREEPDNPYMIQPYFEIIVKSPSRLNIQTQKDLDSMRDTLLSINESKPNSCYYELEAMYAAYIERDLVRAKAFLDTGRHQFQDSSYIERAYFDCCEHHGDIPGMIESLENLKRLIKGTTSISIAYRMREPLLAAHQRQARSFIANMINQIPGINDESKQRLLTKVDLIQRA